MKILYLTARQPYPVTKGDQIIAYEHIKELSKNNEVYLFTFADREIDILNNEMNKYCKEIYICKHSKVNKIICSLKTIFNFKPIQVNCFNRNNARNQIKNIINRIDPDVIHTQSFRMAEYSKDLKRLKSIDLIDSYSENMRKRSQKCGFLKPVWVLEYNLLLKYEKELMSKFKLKTLVSERDKCFFDDDDIIINPNGTSIERLVNVKKENAIIFQGNMSYFPNINAVGILYNDIFPEIKKNRSDIKLYLVGGNVSKTIEMYRAKDIIITGYVESMSEYLNKCRIGVYPVFEATGMQNKIIEAMAAGIPCVITTEVANGITGIKNMENAIVCDNIPAFVKWINELLDNETLYNNIRDNAYKFVRENYSWEKNVKILKEMWDKAYEDRV